MRDGWIETVLGEVADIYQPQTIAKALMDDSAEYIVYGANGPIGRYHKFNHAEREVVVTCRGATCGTINMTPEKTWITGNAMVIHPKSDSLSRQFLFYSLISVVDVHSIISGSAQPQITREGMIPVKISIPPIHEQNRIVDLISSVDSYIEALLQQLRKMKKSRNAVLVELLSQASEKNTMPLLELAKLQRGHDLPTQDRVEGSIPVVASNGVVGFHNTYKALKPGVVTGRSGTIGKVIFIDQNYWPLNTTLYVVDFKGNVPKFVALVLETLNLENYAGGSTVPSLDRNVISQVPVPCLSIDEQKRIVGVIESLDDVVAKSEHAIIEAKNLRSGLLCSLLKGEHEIPASYDNIMGAA